MGLMLSVTLRPKPRDPVTTICSLPADAASAGIVIGFGRVVAVPIFAAAVCACDAGTERRGMHVVTRRLNTRRLPGFLLTLLSFSA
ncbi:hypothetical protein AA13594_0578 [Gluconacetobacter azotocaptans DSM 13594]|nr:hypothetical protein AA13594_0578 [Gluconacetobacter azotocaptans DSM 13594]